MASHKKVLSRLKKNPFDKFEIPVKLHCRLLCSLVLLITGCAIYPLNREYDARILKKDEMSFNVGSALLHKSDRFKDSASDLPKPFVGGFKYGSGVPSFIPFSKYLENMEIGLGGVPLPFVFTIELFAKYNLIKLPTHTFISVYSNLYNAQLVSEYFGYSVRGGGIITQELFWNKNLNLAISSGILFQTYEFAFYSAVDTNNEPDNITRKSRGMYLPISGIFYMRNVFIQCSYEYRIKETRKYTISIYPEETKPIEFARLDKNAVMVSVGYKFESFFNKR